ncbi:MAG: dTDP-4-dehydrorhamnose 3,5-epimerase [Acidimicrobiales bacterium]|jgi:dTDP-4-dehydrorhamnose 3,5-epimerase
MAVDGSFAIEAEWVGDERGQYGKIFSSPIFAEHGLHFDFQDLNISRSVEAGTLRGLKYQNAPHGETKIFFCLSGEVHDVLFDQREGSPTYGTTQVHRLRADDRTALWVPKGVAHGFETLEPNTTVMYLTDHGWAPEAETGIRFDDPVLDAGWPLEPSVIGEKDRTWPLFSSLGS